MLTGRQRDPPFFFGLPGEDVEDWLDQYNRVSQFNSSDDVFQATKCGILPGKGREGVLPQSGGNHQGLDNLY